MNIVRSQGRKQQCQDCVYCRKCYERKREKSGGRHSNFDIIHSKKERKNDLAHTHISENIRSEKAELHSIKLHIIRLCTIECQVIQIRVIFVVAACCLRIRLSYSRATTNLNCRLHLVSLLFFSSFLFSNEKQIKFNDMIPHASPLR